MTNRRATDMDATPVPTQDQSLTFIIPVWTAIALVAGFVLPAFLPETANIITIATMVASVALSPSTGSWRWFAREPAVLLLLAAAATLAAALSITAAGPENFIVLAILLPLWMTGPYAGLLSLGRWLSPVTIASLALLGALGCATVAAYDVYVRGLQRGGELVMNPIHMGDLAVMLGFVALCPLFSRGGPWRLIFLVGPVFALVTVQLTMARGPLIASAAMLLVSLVALVLAHLPRRLAIPGILLTIVASTAIVLHGVLMGWLLTIRGFDQVYGLLTTGISGDGSVNQRLGMYDAAWQAFWVSPLFGHGSVDFVAIALSYLPSSEVLLQYEHLHSDLANFAVIGGALGVASYGLLVATPLAGAISARGRNKNAVRYLGTITSVGYLVMGLTNAMFGILVLTVLYAVILSVMLAMDRAEPRS